MPKGDQNRRTPPWLFQLLEKEVVRRKFLLDTFASPENALCKRFLTSKENALTSKWAKVNFANPPFKMFGAAMKKALDEWENNGATTCLVGPVGCSQSWYHLYAKRGTIYAPDERLAFYDSQTGQPTKGADRDTNIFVFGEEFMNEKPGFRVLPLSVRGKVVRA